MDTETTRDSEARAGEPNAAAGPAPAGGGPDAEPVRADAERIRTAFERNAKALSLRPSAGQGTAVTTCRLREGLACEIEDGRWSLTAGMSGSYGGKGAGPDPGVLGRAALASCLAAGYGMWAARRRVPLHGLTVRVEADYDARAELGVGEDTSPIYPEVRVVVTVESDAPEDDVAAVLAEADAHSPWLAMFREPVRVIRETSVSQPETPFSRPGS